MTANQKMLLPLLPMTASSSEAEYNDGDLPYSIILLFADVPSFFPGPTFHHLNDATPAQIRKLASEKQNR